MKKFHLLITIIVVLFSITGFTIDTNPLVGKWQHSGKSQGQAFDLMAIFRANGTYDGFINKKEFVSGVYHMNHDTLYIADATCNDKYNGTYKIEFFGKLDSLKFHVIQDTCVGRRQGTDGKVFKKLVTAGK
jgi:hypothetical protein